MLRSPQRQQHFRELLTPPMLLVEPVDPDAVTVTSTPPSGEKACPGIGDLRDTICPRNSRSHTPNWAALNLTWYDVRRGISQIATAPTYYAGLCNERGDWLFEVFES
jgi:hypothetical protein